MEEVYYQALTELIHTIKAKEEQTIRQLEESIYQIESIMGAPQIEGLDELTNQFIEVKIKNSLINELKLMSLTQTIKALDEDQNIKPYVQLNNLITTYINKKGVN